MKANCTRVAKLQTRRGRHRLSKGWRTARFSLLSVFHLCTERVQSALMLQFCYSSRASNQNGQRAVTNRTHCCCQKPSQFKAMPCSPVLCLAALTLLEAVSAGHLGRGHVLLQVNRYMQRGPKVDKEAEESPIPLQPLSSVSSPMGMLHL